VTTPRILWWALPLAGCAPFGPNVTGRWQGSCSKGLEMTVVMELADVDNEVEGTAVVTFADDDVYLFGHQLDAFVEGDRTRHDVTIDLGPEDPGRALAVLDATLDGNTLSGSIEADLLSFLRCPIVLER